MTEFLLGVAVGGVAFSIPVGYFFYGLGGRDEARECLRLQGLGVDPDDDPDGNER